MSNGREVINKKTPDLLQGREQYIFRDIPFYPATTLRFFPLKSSLQFLG